VILRLSYSLGQQIRAAMPMRLATVALAVVAVHASQKSGTSTCAGGQCVHDGEGDEVGLLSLRTASSFGPLHPTPAPAPPAICKPCTGTDCIDTPEKYKNAWEALSTKGTERELPFCVSHKLFASSYFDGCGADLLYPDTSQLAWIVSKFDLEQWLYMQYQFGETHPEWVTASVAVIVGFGPPTLDGKLSNLCLGIFNLPDSPCDAAEEGIIPYVPSFAWWFSFLATQNIEDFDLPVQKQIILAYSQMGHGGKTNVLDVFQELTGCSAKLNADGTLEDLIGKAGSDTGCGSGPTQVYTALVEKRQSGTDEAKGGCVQAFLKGQGPKTWSVNNAGDVRMMLWLCFDVNPFNTGVGLGWNSYPNPLLCGTEQTNDEHYTGKEYVILNGPLTNLKNLENITLVDASAESNNHVRDNGFCD